MATCFELSAVADELRFWKRFVNTSRFREWESLRVTPELNPFARDFIKANVKPGDKVLDCGSGVVSILRGLVDVVAVDPLGDLYGLIYKYNKIPQPLPIAAEDITFENEFKIAHMSNALDHSGNPELVLNNLLRACVKGGFVMIQSFENEATYENNRGFHQWNITLMDDWLEVNGRVLKIDARVVVARKETLNTGKNWIIWIAEKL